MFYVVKEYFDLLETNSNVVLISPYCIKYFFSFLKGLLVEIKNNNLRFLYTYFSGILWVRFGYIDR